MYRQRSLHNFLADEDLLARTIQEEKYALTEIPLRYNWPFFEKQRNDAAILHYVGQAGKQAILKEIVP